MPPAPIRMIGRFTLGIGQDDLSFWICSTLIREVPPTNAQLHALTKPRGDSKADW
jgi:hypothetical protein